MAEGDIPDAQPLQNLGAVDLFGDLNDATL